MTALDLGRVMITPRGAYNIETPYELYDTVYKNGVIYVARQDNIGIDPEEDSDGVWSRWLDLADELVDAAQAAADAAAEIATQAATDKAAEAAESAENAADSAQTALDAADRAEEITQLSYTTSQRAGIAKVDGVTLLFGEEGLIFVNRDFLLGELEKGTNTLEVNVIALQIALETYMDAQVNGMSDNVIVETFDSLDGYSIIRGQYDSENRRVYA